MNRVRQGSLVVLLLIAAGVSADGDAERGRQLSQGCVSCHGADGNSPAPENPIIAGQHAAYLYSTLRAYRDGARDNAAMRATVVGMSDEDLADLAAWYAGQRGLGKPVGAPPRTVMSDGEAGSATSSSVLTIPVAALPDPGLCPDGPEGVDSDGDGLPDAFDAAPNDPDEFVLDTNGDGRFEICNIHQLQAIVSLGEGEGAGTGLGLQERLSRDYVLVQDLDAAGIEGFRPIGTCGPTDNCMNDLDTMAFQGNFDGAGFAIRNLTIEFPESAGVGLFGVLAPNRVVRNLVLVDVMVRGHSATGSVVGANLGTVYNVHASGRVEGRYAVGGLVGTNAGVVSWSHSSAEVEGDLAVGGLVGDHNNSLFMSYGTGNVTGRQSVGGLVGSSRRGTIVSSFATGLVSGNGDIGGLVGTHSDSALLANSYATGNVTGGINAGGIVGRQMLSRIYNVYSSGIVTGTESVGGIAGENNGTIMQTYSISPVTADSSAGALVGDNVDGTIGRSYWVRALSGLDSPTGTTGGNFFDTAEMSRLALQQLGGAVSGWASTTGRTDTPVLQYCDRDGSGAIEPSEQVRDNLIWDFGRNSDLPLIRCTVGGVERQGR